MQFVTKTAICLHLGCKSTLFAYYISQCRQITGFTERVSSRAISLCGQLLCNPWHHTSLEIQNLCGRKTKLNLFTFNWNLMLTHRICISKNIFKAKARHCNTYHTLKNLNCIRQVETVIRNVILYIGSIILFVGIIICIKSFS